MAEMAQDTDIDQLKKLVKSDKLVLGTEKTLKALRGGDLTKVYLSTNVPETVEVDFDRYCGLASIDVVKLSMPNDQLGTFCKKPFSISVLGIKK